MSILAESKNRADAQVDSTKAAQTKTKDPLRAKIDFIPNESFENLQLVPDNEAIREAMQGTEQCQAPSDLPAHLKRMCETNLLSHEQEITLFREMNFRKFYANRLREGLSVDSPDPEKVAEISMHLAVAEKIRDHIVHANMRLVISIVKKFVTPQKSFDEMLSDGIMILIQAVEKFDFDRGFRFSTYAYRSIARNAYRTITAAQKEEAQFTRDSEEWAFEQEANGSSAIADQIWGNIRDLMGAMLKNLDRREQFIVRSRYALGAHRKTHTFQSMADKLGISKERARQLEQRAVSKLKAMAAEFDLDELFGAQIV